MGVSCVNGSKGWCRTRLGILEQPSFCLTEIATNCCFDLVCYERGEFSLGVNEKGEKENISEKKKQASFLYPYCVCCASAREWAKNLELQRKL